MAFHKVPSLAVAALLAFTSVPATLAFAQDSGTPAAEAPDGPLPGGPNGPRPGGPRGKGGAFLIERLDKDGDGKLSIEEFAVMSERPMDRFDADDDGSITSDEIDAAILERMVERRRQRILDRFDLDGDGTITAEEIQRQREKIFALMDRNDDGAVDAKEMRMFRKLLGEMGGPGMHKGKGPGGPGHHMGMGPKGPDGGRHGFRGGDDCGPRGGGHHGWRGDGPDGPRWGGRGPGWQGQMQDDGPDGDEDDSAQ